MASDSCAQLYKMIDFSEIVNGYSHTPQNPGWLRAARDMPLLLTY